MCDFQSPKSMYWEGRRPTSLWLLPFAMGFVSGVLPYLINYELFDESSLMGSVGLSALLAVGLLALPDSETDRKIEMLAGIWLGMSISYLPIALFFVWFIPVILYWIGRTLKVQHSHFPPFRIGLWIGSGILSGIYVGNIIAFNLL